MVKYFPAQDCLLLLTNRLTEIDLLLLKMAHHQPVDHALSSIKTLAAVFYKGPGSQHISVAQYTTGISLA